jgi:hypothetical protein
MAHFPSGLDIRAGHMLSPTSQHPLSLSLLTPVDVTDDHPHTTFPNQVRRPVNVTLNAARMLYSKAKAPRSLRPMSDFVGMASTLCLNERQTLLINKFQLGTYSSPAHIPLRIGDYTYIHLRTALSSQHTEGGFQVQTFTSDVADHRFGCCKTMRDAMEPRLGSFSDDAILCSTNLQQSKTPESCYIAIGDDRELAEMIKNGVDEWVLAVLKSPSPRKPVESTFLRRPPINWDIWGVPCYSLSRNRWLCTWLKRQVEAPPDPFFGTHSHKELAGTVTNTLVLPLAAATTPMKIMLEKRFVALAAPWDGLHDLGRLAIYLTNFSYGHLVCNALYHEAIRHCRKCLLETLPAQAIEWLEDVIPEQRTTFSIVSRLGTKVEIYDHGINKGVLVGVTGRNLITHGLVMEGLTQHRAWVVPIEKITFPSLLSAAKRDVHHVT